MYRIEFAPSAYRQFAKLSHEAKRRITPRIDALADNPRPPGADAFTGSNELLRIRVGVYRVVYAIEDDRLLVLAVKVGHRRDIYRDL